jgi:hypothetical protein
MLGADGARGLGCLAARGDDLIQSRCTEWVQSTTKQVRRRERDVWRRQSGEADV